MITITPMNNQIAVWQMNLKSTYCVRYHLVYTSKENGEPYERTICGRTRCRTCPRAY